APPARPDRHLPALRLHHPDRAAGVRAMSSARGIAFQILQSVFVVLAAPLLVGWVNQCRAWLQNRSAPSILLPYYTLAKLFNKDAVFAHDASPIFRWTPYILFGCMWLAAGIVPVLATGLPFAPAADIIALVGVFALARMFSALAAMDIGTSFGGLGARREMLIEWAVAIKLFAYMTIGIALFAPWGIADAGDWSALPHALAALAGKLALAGAGLALIEALLAKLRLFLAPEFLSTAFLLAVLGLLTHFLVKG